MDDINKSSNTQLNDIDVGKLTYLYQNSSKSFSENELQQLSDRLYVTDGNYQLTATDLAELRKRKMAPLTTNYCEKLKRSLVGIIESNPIDPVAIPQNEQSENGADIATKLVRYILNKSKMDSVRLDLASDFFVEGVCATIIEIDTLENKRLNTIKYRPCIKRVSPYDFFYDPTSRERNFSDASFLGIRKWITVAQLQALYPERFDELGSPLEDDSFIGTVDFTDTTAIEMVDRKNKKIVLIELYQKNGTDWNKTVFAANGVYSFDENVLTDDYGHGICPVTAVSNIVDIRYNYRLGSIRRVRNTQDVINQVMIKTSAAINSRQIRQTDIAATIKDINVVRKEASRIDGVIPFGYDIVSNDDTISGNMQLIQNQINFMMDSIPNASVQQTIQSNNASGRSKLVDQELGLIEYADTLKIFSSLEETNYTKIWAATIEYCTEEDVINVSGDPRAPEYLKINHVTGFQQVPVIDPQTNQPLIDPNTLQIIKRPQPIIENSLIEMDVDFTFRQTPNTGSLRGEVFDSFVQLIQSGVQINSPEFEVLLELSPLEDKQEIRDDIAKWYGPAQQFDPQAAQSNAQQQAQLQNLQLQAQIKEGQLRLAKMEADIEQVRSTTLKNLASVQETDANLTSQANLEGIQVQHDLAEANLKEAKARAIDIDIDHEQQNHGLKLASLSSILNN